MNIRYKGYNITVMFDLDKEEIVYNCAKFQKREDPSLLVHREYKDDIFEEKRAFVKKDAEYIGDLLPPDNLRIFHEAKQIIDEHLQNDNN